METFPTGPKKGKTKVWAVVLTIIIMLGLAGGAYYYLNKKFTKERKELQNQIDDLNKQITDAKKTATATPTTTTTTTTPAATNSNIYNNTTYGFSLTFNSKWSGWKVKSENISGTIITYYIEVPTTDANYADSQSTHDGGYTSLFALSVYSPEQWTAAQAEEVNTATKIGETSSYIFAWSSAQAGPEDVLNKGLFEDVKNVIATFKLN